MLVLLVLRLLDTVEVLRSKIGGGCREVGDEGAPEFEEPSTGGGSGFGDCCEG
jgi:hypothetical protein